MSRKKWIEIAGLLRKDINARICCPVCSSENIRVIDAPFDDNNKLKGGERHIICNNCQATNSVLYRQPPENWLASRGQSNKPGS